VDFCAVGTAQIKTAPCSSAEDKAFCIIPSDFIVSLKAVDKTLCGVSDVRSDTLEEFSVALSDLLDKVV
jgi:hypothetical protein